MKAKIRRQSLAKEVAARESIFEKWFRAAGYGLIGDLTVPKTDAELFYFLERVRQSHAWLMDSRGNMPPERAKMFRRRMANLGCVMMAAMVEPAEQRFFDRLIAILRYNRRPGRHQLYTDILTFCVESDPHSKVVGTKENPCDPLKLLEYLNKRRRVISPQNDNEILRTLRATCKKLGVFLTSARRGRLNKTQR